MKRTKHKKYSSNKAGEPHKKWNGRIFVAGLIIIIVILFAYRDRYAFNNNDREAEYKGNPQSTKLKKEPVFIKEGALTFFDQETKKSIITIDIEIAYTPQEMKTGLMYRRSMPETAGMLFQFDRGTPVFFWMKNTYIPLDMIFVDRDMKIVKIYQNAEPMSVKPIHLHKKTRYTIEVNAGFCERHGITIGDYITIHRF